MKTKIVNYEIYKFSIWYLINEGRQLINWRIRHIAIKYEVSNWCFSWYRFSDFLDKIYLILRQHTYLFKRHITLNIFFNSFFSLLWL